MGIDRTTYIGPYVQCFYEAHNEPDPYDIQEAINEDLYVALGDSIWAKMRSENCHIYLPNKGLDCSACILDDDDALFTSLSAIDIQEANRELLIKYETAIQKLREIYQDYIVVYGIVHYIY